jgi:hypothetical protein
MAKVEGSNPFIRFSVRPADNLDALGMTPRSRARLGLDVRRAQTFDRAPTVAGAGRCVTAIAYSAGPTALRAS